MKQEYDCAVYYKMISETKKNGYADQKTASRQLLQYAFRDFFDMELIESRIGRMPGGKPCYHGEGSYFFNISHCAHAVVAAVARSPVGVDAEALRRVNRRTVEKCCSAPEAEYVFGSSEAGRDRTKALSEEEAGRFLHLWTLKESYVKMTGEGLRMPLDAACFDISEFQETHPGILRRVWPGQYESCLYTRPGRGLAIALTIRRGPCDADAHILWVPCASASGAR